MGALMLFTFIAILLIFLIGLLAVIAVSLLITLVDKLITNFKKPPVIDEMELLEKLKLLKIELCKMTLTLCPFAKVLVGCSYPQEEARTGLRSCNSDRPYCLRKPEGFKATELLQQEIAKVENELEIIYNKQIKDF